MKNKEEIDYTEWSKEKFDKWTKIQIYQALLREVEKSKMLQDKADKQQYKLTEIRNLTK